MKLTILLGLVILAVVCSADHEEGQNHVEDNHAGHSEGHHDHGGHKHHDHAGHAHSEHGHGHDHEHGEDDDHTGHVHGVDCHASSTAPPA